jgi:succinyl-CoA synthetase alpha subunit
MLGILINSKTNVIVQGATGAYARMQLPVMVNNGTRIVAGTSPGKGGEFITEIPIFDTVKEAKHSYPEINTSIIYVPPFSVKDAVLEALESGIKLLVVPTEGVPLHDAIAIKHFVNINEAWLIGPNSLGIITPGSSLVGSIPPDYTLPGNVGLISRSGTLSLAVVKALTENGIGQSTCVSVGGDKVLGKNPADYLIEFENDQNTDAVVLLGEIGGSKEYEAASFIKNMKKPVVSFLVGRSAAPGKTMGHIGAIVTEARDTVEKKIEYLKESGSLIADTIWDIPQILDEVIK